MPRVFVDFHDGETLIRDDEGGVVQTMEHARQHAIGLLQLALERPLQDGITYRFTACVRDETGSKLYQATVTFEGDLRLVK